MADTLKDWLATQPPTSARFTQTLAVVASRSMTGTDFRHAVHDFLEEFALLPTATLRQAAIDEEPQLTGDCRHDAYLAALAEHLAIHHACRCPEWALADHRFLERFWFVSGVDGFRAIALAQSPPSFKRRGVLVPARSLRRV